MNVLVERRHKCSLRPNTAHGASHRRFLNNQAWTQSHQVFGDI